MKPAIKVKRKWNFPSLKKPEFVLQLQKRHIVVCDSINVVDEVDNEDLSKKICRVKIVNHESLPEAVDKVAQVKNIITESYEF